MNRYILHIAAIDNRKKLKYATIFNPIMSWSFKTLFLSANLLLKRVWVADPKVL